MKPKFAKRARPHYKKEKPAREKGAQTRKSGKGTSLMHAAARRQSSKESADSNMSPIPPASAKVPANRADHALAEMTKRNPS